MQSSTNHLVIGLFVLVFLCVLGGVLRTQFFNVREQHCHCFSAAMYRIKSADSAESKPETSGAIECKFHTAEPDAGEAGSA